MSAQGGWLRSVRELMEFCAASDALPDKVREANIWSSALSQTVPTSGGNNEKKRRKKKESSY